MVIKLFKAPSSAQCK